MPKVNGKLEIHHVPVTVEMELQTAGITGPIITTESLNTCQEECLEHDQCNGGLFDHTKNDCYLLKSLEKSTQKSFTSQTSFVMATVEEDACFSSLFVPIS
uniref:Apple domain-containing protein n=1 Tax=Steinernema glaseri TaxID=37863 RepID=A0A1I7Y5R0_9BILA